jgi:hypothetical protein
MKFFGFQLDRTYNMVMIDQLAKIESFGTK